MKVLWEQHLYKRVDGPSEWWQLSLAAVKLPSHSVCSWTWTPQWTGAEKGKWPSSDYFCLFLFLLLFCVYVWCVHVHACVGQKSNLRCCSSFITGFITGMKLTCSSCLAGQCTLWIHLAFVPHSSTRIIVMWHRPCFCLHVLWMELRSSCLHKHYQPWFYFLFVPGSHIVPFTISVWSIAGEGGVSKLWPVLFFTIPYWLTNLDYSS